MIFTIGPSIWDRIDRRTLAKQKWHRWFAWCPVRVTHDKIVFWQHVERRGGIHSDMNGDHWHFEYRQIGDSDET